MKPELKLRPYQVEDLALLMREPRFGLLSDPRTGKTPPVCVYIYWLWDDKRQCSIWTMPKSLLHKNHDELVDWTPFTPADLCIFDGHNDRPEHRVFLMTQKRFSKSWRELLDRHTNIGTHVTDEPHVDGGFKTDSSQTCQALYFSSDKIERFVPMTGSLINGRLTSAYPVIRMIEPRYYPNEKVFLNYHAVRDPWTLKIVGWQNHQRLRTIIEAHSSRRSFADCYGEKTIVIDREIVEMSPVQRDKYDEFHETALLELEDRWLDGSLPGVNTIRCRQIMAHPENVELPTHYNDKGSPVAWKSYNLVGAETTGKDAALYLHMVNHYNTGKPLIIFTSLQPEQRRCAQLAQKVGLRTGLINGDISMSRRSVIDKDLIAGRLDCVVASWATAGMGYNWGCVDHVVAVSIDYQDANFLQGLMRGMTPDKRGMLVTTLEYRESIDQRQFQIVEQKSRDANAVDPSRPVICLAQGKIVLGQKNPLHGGMPMHIT